MPPPAGVEGVLVAADERGVPLVADDCLGIAVRVPDADALGDDRAEAGLEVDLVDRAS